MFPISVNLGLELALIHHNPFIGFQLLQAALDSGSSLTFADKSSESYCREALAQEKAEKDVFHQTDNEICLFIDDHLPFPQKLTPFLYNEDVLWFENFLRKWFLDIPNA